MALYQVMQGAEGKSASTGKRADWMTTEPSKSAVRILVAEDDDAMRIFLLNALSRAGHDVNAMPSGESAVTCAGLGSYDLLLTDVEMPGMDGVDLARLMMADSPKLRVMFVTGYAEKALQATDVISRGARVLSKPFALSDLVRQVQTMIAAPV
jgi:two-component system, cell cycle response regulator CpdR